MDKYPDWAKTYNFFSSHDHAMDAIASELSRSCDLPLHALQIWLGRHYMGFGIVFFDDSMVPWKRTPEDTERINKLEGLLESMGVLKTEKAEFEVLCSAACPAHPVEPLEMVRRPPPPDWERDQGYELMCLMSELNEKYPCRKQQNPREEKGSGGKQSESKKRRNRKVHPRQVDRKSRCVLSSWNLVYGSLLR